MLQHHNHAVPLVGGPLCGESMTIDGCSLPKNLPMFYENKFYMYELNVDECENYVSVFYHFSNEINNINNRGRKGIDYNK
jgi:hypothetical protein